MLESLSTFPDTLFGVLNPSRHGVGLLWTRDQFVVKSSTDTRQQNLYTQETSIDALSSIRTRDPSNQVAKTYALDRAATGIGNNSN
jgi:hypothetical protein